MRTHVVGDVHDEHGLIAEAGAARPATDDADQSRRERLSRSRCGGGRHVVVQRRGAVLKAESRRAEDGLTARRSVAVLPGDVGHEVGQLRGKGWGKRSGEVPLQRL